MPTTSLCRSTPDDIFIRDRSLPHELLGNTTFTEMIYFHLTGRDATPGQAALLDACLVAIMDHGITPTVMSTRLAYTSAPEAMQGAVASGLLGVGSLLVGTMEGCAELLARVVAAEDGVQEAGVIAREHVVGGRRVPGFGHPLHHPVDPRTVRLMELAREHELFGAHCEALQQLSAAVDAAVGRPLTVNATAAFAAVLRDADLPANILRGLALISRCAGLVGHIHEEQADPSLKALWAAGERAIPHER